MRRVIISSDVNWRGGSRDAKPNVGIGCQVHVQLPETTFRFLATEYNLKMEASQAGIRTCSLTIQPLRITNIIIYKKILWIINTIYLCCSSRILFWQHYYFKSMINCNIAHYSFDVFIIIVSFYTAEDVTPVYLILLYEYYGICVYNWYKLL